MILKMNIMNYHLDNYYIKTKTLKYQYYENINNNINNNNNYMHRNYKDKSFVVNRTSKWERLFLLDPGIIDV